MPFNRLLLHLTLTKQKQPRDKYSYLDMDLGSCQINIFITTGVNLTVLD